jgi:hypothetical protein
VDWINLGITQNGDWWRDVVGRVIKRRGPRRAGGVSTVSSKGLCCMEFVTRCGP